VKIAAITDDEQTISLHFGRARYYRVYTIEEDAIVNRETRSKAGHHDFVREDDHEHEGRNDLRGHGFGRGAARRHERMIGAITDCDVILVRGMGRGAYLAMEEADIKPIVTDIGLIEEAVLAYLDGEIVDHTERLH
jgi:predicted Fe-Mo cluster-binding NifX family protein